MNPWPITPITDKDLNFAIVNYGFTSFTANEQSELPSLEGALDTSLLDFAASIADQTVLIASLFDGLGDLGVILGEIDSSDDVGNTLSDLANSAAAGDAALGDYTGQIGGSTGGGGGGGSTPQCGTLDFGSVPIADPTGSHRVPHTIGLQNTGSQPLRITGTNWSPNLGFIFVVAPDISGSVIQPGDTLQITIIFTPGQVGSYASTLTVQTDAPDPQPCLNVTGSGIAVTPIHPPLPRCPTGNIVIPGKHTLKPQCA